MLMDSCTYADEREPYPCISGAATIAVKPKSEIHLTKRELEIARLIAREMTSRDIASNLFISERTVEAHVTNMLNKLGLNSRIELARWLGSVEPVTPAA